MESPGALGLPRGRAGADSPRGNGAAAVALGSLRAARAWAETRLRAAGLDRRDAAVEAALLLRCAAGLAREELLLRPDGVLHAAAAQAYADLIERRAAGCPSAYLIGSREFYGLVFEVDSRVLIPRPETERLVEAVAASLAGANAPLIADVGTGSGAIALTLARLLPAARIIATDLSSDALDVARSNAARLGLADRVTWRQGDALEPLAGAVAERSADAICANPPYIPTADLGTLPREVRAQEPLVALDGGADGLGVQRRIIAGAARYLRPGGVLALETSALGGQARAVAAAIAREDAFEPAEIIRDYAGLDRVVVARRG